jgi:hypothetical protein
MGGGGGSRMLLAMQWIFWYGRSVFSAVTCQPYIFVTFILAFFTWHA